MKHDQSNNLVKSFTKRNLLLTSVVSIPVAAANWVKPVVESVVLPSHASTTDIVAATTAAPGTTSAPNATEVFFATIPPGSGFSSQGSQIRVVASQGSFTLEIYNDGFDTDLGASIGRGSAASEGTINVAVAGCGNDGSEGPATQNTNYTVDQYISGISIRVSQGGLGFTLLLNNGVAALSCPIL